MNARTPDQGAALTDLNGRSIARWVALEMALSEGADGHGPVLWEHESIPYFQLVSIDIQMVDGAKYRMLSQSDDGTGYYGLYLVSIETLDAPTAYEEGSIFRTRELKELPLGLVTAIAAPVDGPDAGLRADIDIGAQTVSCWAAEVYEEGEGTFRIVGGDECILLQLDRARPASNL